MKTEIESLGLRIIELETRLAFQDDTIEELNGVIISQQHQIDRLESSLNIIKKQLPRVLSGEDGSP
jgi:SlyX protein